MNKKWILYLNFISMSLAAYGGLLLVFEGLYSTSAMLYGLLFLAGTAGLIVSFYVQCAYLGAVDGKKLPQVFLFWGAELFCGALVLYRSISSAGQPQAVLQLVISLVMMAGAAAAFQKFGVPVRFGAARLDRLFARPAEYLNRGKRRYTMMVTRTEQEGGMYLAGRVHGEIRRGDTAVLLLPSGSAQRFRIRGIRQNGRNVASVRDGEAELLAAGLKEKAENLRFAVVSSVLPSGRQPSVTAENPLLRGMSYEYAAYTHDHEFMTSFIRVLTHSRFMVPVMISRTDAKGAAPGGTADTQIGFMAVSRSEGGKETRTFALFSDEEALHGWRQLYRKGRPSTLSVTFQDAVSIMKKGHQGIVINPFGPVFVYLPAELINVIVHQDTYRREFGEPGSTGLSFENRKNWPED